MREALQTILNRTYMEDGLITRHAAAFLEDPRFQWAYAKGKATESWNGSNPRWRVYTACWAASHAANLPGDFVECGVNRGGMPLTICEYLDFNKLDKQFFLVDTYTKDAPYPYSKENCGQTEDCYCEVKNRFSHWPGVRVICGRVPEVLPQVTAERISYLSIDMNSAEPEIAAFRALWPRVAKTGIVLLDDYAGGPLYAEQKRAFDALNLNILTLPTGQGLILKS